MKIKFCLSAFQVIFFASFMNVQGQNYRPFMPNTIPIFTCQYNFYTPQAEESGLYSLRVWNGYQRGDDSIFTFNRVTSRRANTVDYYNNQDNVFGRELIEKAGGIYQFATSDSDTFLLKTLEPIQSSWTYNIKTGITAKIIDRKTENIFDAITDSVIHIKLSDGNDIFLSQNYGLIKAKPLIIVHGYGSYATGYFELVGIENRGLGEAPPRFGRMLDIQVGEVFITNKTINYWGGSFYDIYTKRKVASRSYNTSTSTLDLTFEEEELNILHKNIPGVPNDTTYTKTFSSETYSKSSYTPELSLSNETLPFGFLYYLSGPFISKKWNGRMFYWVAEYLGTDSTGKLIGYIEGINQFAFVEGVGIVNGSFYDSNPEVYRDIRLECYQKLTDSVGDCGSYDALITHNELLPAYELNIYPNPAQNDIHIEHSNLTGKVEILLLDLTGKMVLRKKYSAPITRLFIANLPTGLYILKLNQKGKIIYTDKVSIIR